MDARRRLQFDMLEGRCVPSGLTRPGVGVAPTVVAVGGLVGDINGDGRVDLADERAFAAAYLSKVGDARYNPAADLNHNGQVGQVDGRILLANLTTRPPRTPLRVVIHLVPTDLARPPHSTNSGGVTRKADVTIVGKTIPQSLIFSDTGLGDYTFRGPVFVADENGIFREPVHLTGAFTNFNFLIVDPFGHQVIRDYPIVYQPA